MPETPCRRWNSGSASDLLSTVPDATPPPSRSFSRVTANVRDAGVDSASRQAAPSNTTEESAMLRYALIFFIIAIIAAVLGFSGVAGAASSIAYILAVIFVVLFILSLIFGRRGHL
jgi:uncharacterized membrane protein YtjA (UPF0391 family)